MSSNILVAKDELITVNNELYGSTRLKMTSPYVMQIAGQEENYSNGELEEQDHKKIIYDLVQRFPETEIAQLFKGEASEKKQAHIAPSEFKFVRRASLVEIQYSNLKKTVNKSQPRARLLAELMKQYDHASYNGMWGNTGIVNNSKVYTMSQQQGTTLSQIITAISDGLSYFKALGWRSEDLEQVKITLSQSVDTKLSNVGNERTDTDKVILQRAFENAEIITMPSWVKTGDFVEISLTPLIKHHHGGLPSLYNEYMSNDGLTSFDMFAFETSALEIEEQNAYVIIPLALTA